MGLTQYSNTPIPISFLRMRRFHVGKLGQFDVHLKPARAAVIAAEKIAVSLSRVHAIRTCRIESEAFDKTLVGLRDLSFELMPAFAAVRRLDQECFGAGLPLSPLAGLAVCNGRVKDIGFLRVNCQGHGVFLFKLRGHWRPVLAAVGAGIKRAPGRRPRSAVMTAGGDKNFVAVL